MQGRFVVNQIVTVVVGTSGIQLGVERVIESAESSSYGFAVQLTGLG